jgi:hypothetical protein
MAHFAEILNGIVQRVIVVNNEVIQDKNGVEQENIGIDFCKFLYGENTQWVQTSYNNNFRGRYAGIGYTYDGEKFVAPEPTEGE